jgi:hypothetical protein
LSKEKQQKAQRLVFMIVHFYKNFSTNHHFGQIMAIPNLFSKGIDRVNEFLRKTSRVALPLALVVASIPSILSEFLNAFTIS